MANIQITAPAAEAITLTEAKDHLEETRSTKDAYISRLIKVAREHCQSFTRRAIVLHEREETLDFFPASGLIRLRYPPIVSITSVIYLDSDGAEQTLSASSYTLDNASGSANSWLAIASGLSWPVTYSRINSVRIRYMAGYPADAVPEALKQWMLVFIGDLYANRESQSAAGTTTTFDYVDRMIDKFRVY